jgi:RNA polymerase sigma factor (sigma-70 family)
VRDHEVRVSLGVDVEDFYRRYGPMVQRRCRQLLKDEEAAMDAAQEVFVKVLVHQERLGAQAPSSLLYRIATNTCLNRLRSGRRRPEDRDEALLLQIAAVDDQEGQSLAGNVLQRLFGREQASTRTIAVMHLLDGLTLEEVAAEVGLSVSGVRKRLRGLRSHVQELEGV